jgi:alpha-D-ribose 1-methylphosphonate 5-triphosphate diphosphatase
MDIAIEGGELLHDGVFDEGALTVSGGTIAQLSSRGTRNAASLDARGLLVLPGVVDIHGDAFERQIMPRPGVDFAMDIALIDSDRQAIANGITTVFHGLTWSWEPGLRGSENAHRLVDALDAVRPNLAADTRLHLRHETYNLDAEPMLQRWLSEKRIGLLAFNDHMKQAKIDTTRPQKRGGMVQRTGLSDEQFDALVARIDARADEVQPSVKRLAASAQAAGVRMLSHDDESPLQRIDYRALGVAVSEFPTNEETAREAIAGGDLTVFGAPNVVRGGSHTGWTSAAAMVEKGLCSILASDYYYPAPLLAPFRLAAERIVPLAEAWTLVSSAPAVAAGLDDRGSLSVGKRADIILVDASAALRPRVVAVMAAGQLVYLSEAQRLHTGRSILEAIERTQITA